MSFTTLLLVTTIPLFGGRSPHYSWKAAKSVKLSMNFSLFCLRRGWPKTPSNCLILTALALMGMHACTRVPLRSTSRCIHAATQLFLIFREPASKIWILEFRLNCTSVFLFPQFFFPHSTSYDVYLRPNIWFSDVMPPFLAALSLTKNVLQFSREKWTRVKRFFCVSLHTSSSYLKENLNKWKQP